MWWPSMSGPRTSWRNWSRRYARLIGIEASAGAIDAALTERRALLARRAYLSSVDVARAGSDAQQRAREIFTKAGLEVSSTQILPAKAVEGFDRIPVVLRVEGDLSALQSALVVIPAQTPSLFIEGFNVQATGMPAKGRRPAAARHASQPGRLAGAPMKRRNHVAGRFRRAAAVPAGLAVDRPARRLAWNALAAAAPPSSRTWAAFRRRWSAREDADVARLMAILDRPIFSPTRRPPPPPKSVAAARADPLDAIHLYGLFGGSGGGGVIVQVDGKDAAREGVRNHRGLEPQGDPGPGSGVCARR